MAVILIVLVPIAVLLSYAAVYDLKPRRRHALGEDMRAVRAAAYKDSVKGGSSGDFGGGG